MALAIGVSAATDIGLLVPAKPPTLSLSFGNPTDYSTLKPDPVGLPLGEVGTRFRGETTVHLEETFEERPPGTFRYGGPGNSWSDLTLLSPSLGNTSESPIRYRFNSLIINRSTGIGYFTGATTPQTLVWDFPSPVARVYFRVEWTVSFLGMPFEERECRFDPVTFKVSCTDVTRQSYAQFNASIRIDGYGSIPVPAPGVSPNLGPGVYSYSGQVSGEAGVPYLGLNLNHSYYVGQSTRGNSEVGMEIRIYASSEPLPPPVGPPLTYTVGPDGRVTLSWPANSPGYRVEETSQLGPPTWVAANVTPTSDGTRTSVVLPSGASQAFFRLAKQ